MQTNYSLINFLEIKLIIFDFDGVWTDNKVITDSNGIEYVSTSRSDSWGLTIFREYCVENNLDIELVVITTESNKVVKQRCEKLSLKCYSSTKNKLELLQKLSKKLGVSPNSNHQYKEIVFAGNDLNDFEAMKVCNLNACPLDANDKIKKISKFVGSRNGGNGFVREFLEWIIENLNSQNMSKKV